MTPSPTLSSRMTTLLSWAGAARIELSYAADSRMLWKGLEGIPALFTIPLVVGPEVAKVSSSAGLTVVAQQPES